MIREVQSSTPSGFAVLGLTLAVLGASVWGIVRVARAAEGREDALLIGALLLVILIDVVVMSGLFTVEPNQGIVLTLFGAYKGTEKNPGLRWANPFLSKRKISRG